MTLAVRTILMLLVAGHAALPAVAQTGATPTEPARATTAPIPGVTGAITWRDDPITTVDRVTVEVSITVRPGIGVEPWTEAYSTALADAGWTVVGSAAAPPSLTNEGLIEHAAAFLVEPFLDGGYTIPEAVVPVVLPDGGLTDTIIPGGSITVASVLPPEEQDVDPFAALIGQAEPDSEPDPDADTPLGQLPPPPPDPKWRPGPLAIAGTVVLAVLGLVIIRAALRAMRDRPSRAPDPVRGLARLAKRDPDPQQLDEADRLFRAAARSHGVENTPDVRALIERLEHARYAPERSPDESRELIRRAADLARAFAREGAR